ncbi:MAG TPA: efflux RND transporter periplasmic adaptor subunit [Saprospiraceae bacterium]|nr:efflux RND transporter periplasmic adaptor subunit [Saprospiraceae bacterium]
MSSNKKNKWWIWTLIGLVILLIIGGVYKSRTTKHGLEVTLEKAQDRTISEMVTASGKIYPEKEVKVSSDVSGEVIGLYVKEGDTVKAGQLLAKINPDTYLPTIQRGEASVSSSKAQEQTSRAQISAAKAQIAQIDAQVDLARQTNKRNTQLFKEGVISKADLESSQANLKGLEANLRSAKASLSQAESNASAAGYGTKSAQASLQEMRTSLNKTMIYAPVDGIVSRLNIEKGERVLGTIQMSGTEIMTIANLNVIEVQVEVSENDIVRVSRGNEATIEIDAFYGEKFKGVVTEIANSASTSLGSGAATLNTGQVTNFVVKIRMDYDSYKNKIVKNKPFPFRPGMSASVEINTNTAENTLSVSIQSVTTREDEKMSKKDTTFNTDKIMEVVFVKSADSVNMVRVKTGIQDDEFIQILEGLKAGDEIVTGPYSTVSRTLKQGDKIVETKEKKNKVDEKKG